jgi:L-ascorbate metabolism protein UlaG (beta-lactamase superfamily)
MIVRRLTWAGLELQTSETTAVVDLLGGRPGLSQYAGDPQEELLAPAAAPGTVAGAAVTHLHTDHFDVEALQRALSPEAPVLCPSAVVDQVAEKGLNARGIELWETADVAGLQFTAVPAVDGFGAAQVSWVVSDGETRLIHCGDTLWHGYWWHIADRCGPFDVAFVPINAAVADFDYLEPSTTGLPAVMTPEQAAAAAQVLGARETAPIHYGTFHKPPTYLAYPDAEASFVLACRRRGVTSRLLQAGDEVDLAPAVAG